MALYKICKDCGSNLDWGEICDCKRKCQRLTEQNQALALPQKCTQEIQHQNNNINKIKCKG